eukprot:12424984-Karenia_brevis.AAC.1
MELALPAAVTAFRFVQDVLLKVGLAAFGNVLTESSCPDCVCSCAPIPECPKQQAHTCNPI